VDYSAAKTLPSLHGLLQEKGIRLVVVLVLDDVRAESHYEPALLSGKDAFFDTPGDGMSAYREQADAAAP
jgi:hypothetical protein